MQTSTGSLTTRAELFLASAVVAAHASFREPGFRQRDVRFLVELFSNWVESSLRDKVLAIQNTQVLRYLDNLTSEGFADRITRARPPRYRLTRVGLIELVIRLVEGGTVGSPEQFFFLFYFIHNYRERLQQLVKAEGKQFPNSLRIELETLLDEAELLRREIKRIENELVKIEARCEDARNTAEYVKRKLAQGAKFEVVVAEVEEKFPYELNSQKPLTELIASVPPDQRKWELEVGNMRRSEQIWQPSQALLKCYLTELKRLR